MDVNEKSTFQDFVSAIIYFFYYNNRQKMRQNNRSILFTKNQVFNELHKAFIESLCFCSFLVLVGTMPRSNYARDLFDHVIQIK